MKKWIADLYDERDQILDRLKKLQHFRDTAQVPDIDLVRDQIDSMNEYLSIVNKRIIRLEGFNHDSTK